MNILRCWLAQTLIASATWFQFNHFCPATVILVFQQISVRTEDDTFRRILEKMEFPLLGIVIFNV